jgi:hypothetical protein
MISLTLFFISNFTLQIVQSIVQNNALGNHMNNQLDTILPARYMVGDRGRLREGAKGLQPLPWASLNALLCNSPRRHAVATSISDTRALQRRPRPCLVVS